MDRYESEINRLASQVEALLANPNAAEAGAMPGGVFILQGHEVLALPRDNGDSRYPYGQDGFNFWVYASGYMHSNEGLFSHFLRSAEGQEPNIAFFVGWPYAETQGRYTAVSLLPVPQLDESNAGPVQRYTVLTTTAAYFFTRTTTLRFALRVLVTPAKDICFTLRVANLTDQPQRFFVSSYMNPFLRNQIHESGEDRWFKEVRVMEDPAAGRLGSFRIQVNEDKDRTSSISHYGVLRRQFTPDPNSRLTRHAETTSRYDYVGGSRGSLHHAAALRTGAFRASQSVCTFVETAVAADLLHLELGANESARLDTVFQYTMDADQAASLIGQPVDPASIDEQWDALQQMDTQRHEALSLSICGVTDDRLKGPVFNAFIEHLKRQVDFCALIKGYIQLSPNSLIGIRDVFQALEALAFWRPRATRVKMLEALGYTTPSGRCFRQYSLPTSTGHLGRQDLRPFIDQGVWIISAIATYLGISGDWAFLDEPCGYHEIVDEAAGLVQLVDRQDTVLEHLFKIIDFLLEHRDHEQTGCVRAMYGDWNDALDGLGVSQDPSRAYGSGVSVMATLQVYQNCHEMVAMLEAQYPQAHTDRIAAYQQAGRELEESLKRFAIVENDSGERRLVHGWGDQRDYLVGGFNDPDGEARDGLTSNAFWVLSGLYERDPSERDVILSAFERLDSKYGLMTFQPAFPENVQGVGRIGKLPPGTAENGATYVHATAFAVMALFKMGRPRLAWEQLLKILPFTDLHENLSHSPFVMPNSYGYNEAKNIDGQNMNDWQTGSSNVVLKLLIRYVFGLEPLVNGLWIQPASWAPFTESQLVTQVQGRTLRLIYEDHGNQSRQFVVNDQGRQGVDDEWMRMTKLWLTYDALNREENVIRVTQ